MVYTAMDAADQLQTRGLQAAVVNARFAKPLDEATILDRAKGKKLIVTLEEGSLIGGFGDAVMEFLGNQPGNFPKIRTLGIPDRFVEHGKREILLDSVGLSASKILEVVLKELKVTDQRMIETGSLISTR